MSAFDPTDTLASQLAVEVQKFTQRHPLEGTVLVQGMFNALPKWDIPELSPRDGELFCPHCNDEVFTLIAVAMSIWTTDDPDSKMTTTQINYTTQCCNEPVRIPEGYTL